MCSKIFDIILIFCRHVFMSFYTADTDLLTKTLNVPFKSFEVLLFKQIKFRIVHYFREVDIQYFGLSIGTLITLCLCCSRSCFLN